MQPFKKWHLCPIPRTMLPQALQEQLNSSEMQVRQLQDAVEDAVLDERVHMMERAR